MVFIGHIHNDLWNIRTLVIASTAEEAREIVHAKFADALGDTYRDADLRIVAFGGPPEQGGAAKEAFTSRLG